MKRALTRQGKKTTQDKYGPMNRKSSMETGGATSLMILPEIAEKSKATFSKGLANNGRKSKKLVKSQMKLQ